MYNYRSFILLMCTERQRWKKSSLPALSLQFTVLKKIGLPCRQSASNSSSNKSYPERQFFIVSSQRDMTMRWETFIYSTGIVSVFPLPPSSSWKSFSYKPHSGRTKRGTNHSETARSVLRDPGRLNAKSVERNSFGDSAKGQVDGSSDKSLMRLKSTTQKQYAWGGGLVSSRPFPSPSRGRTGAHILPLWAYQWQTR